MSGGGRRGCRLCINHRMKTNLARTKLNTQTVATTRVKLLMESITHVAHRTWMRVETHWWTWTCNSHPWVRPGSYWRNRWNKIISDWHKSWYVRGQEELVAKADYGKLPITTFPFRCGRRPWCQEGRRRYAMQKTQTTKSSLLPQMCKIYIFFISGPFFDRERWCVLIWDTERRTRPSKYSQVKVLINANLTLFHSGIQCPVKQSQTGWETSSKTSSLQQTTSWQWNCLAQKKP